MKYLIALIALLVTAPAYAADSVEGHWLTQNKRAVVQIEECESSLCGYIYWIIEGGLQYDENNPNESMRTQPMCGLQILSGFEKEGEGEWEDGKIYKADDGDIYDADIEIQEDGTLRLRGYVGVPMFGKTQIWTRANKADYAACKAPS